MDMLQQPTSPATATGEPLLPPRGLRIVQAARYAGVSTWFIRQAIWEGRLKARRCGKFVIILRDELDCFLENRPLVEPSSAAWLAQRNNPA
jgi:excisionase family DNA binding protein